MKIGLMLPVDETGMNGQTPRFRDLAAMAEAAEHLGFDSLWAADHLLYRIPEQPESGSWEVFTILSALAARTSRVTIAPLVAATSFRPPALLAKMADALDEVSAGRFILGLGAGWHRPEYDAFGYPFDHRVSRFEEAIQIIHGLLRHGRIDFRGEYYQAPDCVLRPRGPSETGPRILVGTSGPRMLRLTARYADAWNTAWHITPAAAVGKHRLLEEACAAEGRDPTSIEWTCGTIISVREPGEEGAPEKAIKGSPTEIAQQLHGFAEAGVDHLIVIVDPSGVNGIERFARILELVR